MPCLPIFNIRRMQCIVGRALAHGRQQIHNPHLMQHICQILFIQSCNKPSLNQSVDYCLQALNLCMFTSYLFPVPVCDCVSFLFPAHSNHNTTAQPAATACPVQSCNKFLSYTLFHLEDSGDQEQSNNPRCSTLLKQFPGLY